MTKDAALRLALDALEMYELETNSEFQRKAITAIKKALAQPTPDPIAVVTGTHAGYFVVNPTDPAMVLPVNMALYTRSREWKDLTDEEIEKMRHLIDWTADWSYGTFARAIEAKLRRRTHE